MTLDRTITLDEGKELFPEIHEYVTNFAVGFVRIEGDENDATPAGSGTLVKAEGRYGILTADHVLKALPSSGKSGLVFPIARTEPRIHRYILDAASVHKLCVGQASYNQSGPDLGILVLGNPDVGTLEATKIFYNLSTRRERTLSLPPEIERGGWFLVGMAAEWTSDLPVERGFTRVKAFRGLCGAGVVTTEYQTGAYDYLNFQAKYNDAYEGPTSYQGFSGGGLWQVRILDHDGKLEVDDVLLSGVAFYESAIVGDVRTIYCHGRRSVYERAYSALAST
jgi:hypothetical protein